MNLIALVDNKWGIARNGEQITRLNEDMKTFRRLTMDNTVIMGRKTFEAIGRPLTGRRNIVLSKDGTFQPTGAEVAHSKTELLMMLSKQEMERAWVIGGASVYILMLDMCEKAFISKVDVDMCADQFIPNLDELKNWECEYIEMHGNYNLSIYRRV